MGAACQEEYDQRHSLRAIGRTMPQPVVKAERSFTFNEQDIKIILARYVEDHYPDCHDISPTDVKGDYAKATYGSQLDMSPGYCRFTVTVRG